MEKYMNKLTLILLMLITSFFIGCGINSTSADLSAEELAIIADTTYNYQQLNTGSHRSIISGYYPNYLTGTSVYNLDSLTYEREYTYDAMLTDMNNIDTTNDSTTYSEQLFIQINQAKTRIKVYFNGEWVTANDIADSTLFTEIPTTYDANYDNYMYNNKYYSFKWINSSQILFYYVNIYRNHGSNFYHTAIMLNLDLSDSTNTNN